MVPGFKTLACQQDQARLVIIPLHCSNEYSFARASGAVNEHPSLRWHIPVTAR